MNNSQNQSTSAIETQSKTKEFNARTIDILEMIAIGKPTSDIYDAIAMLYESRHAGLRCSMLELEDGVLLHGGAPSMPKEYCNAVHGLKNGPDIGSCGTSTYTGKRCIVEDIDTDHKWADIKHLALPHGMRCCWSEPIIDSKGDVLGAFGMYYNHPAIPNEVESADLTSAARLAGLVMERDHNQKKMRELAYVDDLTKLASRACFFEYLDDLIRKSENDMLPFTLIYLDLDNFKIINDSLGHDVGDKLLKIIAERLTTCSEKIDFIARLGGDEFCIVIKNTPNLHTEENTIKKVIGCIAEPIDLGSSLHTPSCSVGVAHFPENGTETSDLLKAADTALYTAKELGKSRYSFYIPELTKQAEYRYYFEQSLRDAVKHEKLSLVYQPKFCAQTNAIKGVEALSRWQHPEFGDVSPHEFIDVAERVGIIDVLTKWVLYTACKQAVEWKRLGVCPLTVAVNISPSLFIDNNFVELVRTVIKDTGIEPEMLELEVTENVVQTDAENLKTFAELQKMGIRLAIDDFGTGYSSFASLKHLNVDSLKIDKYFVSDMSNDEISKYLISSMINIGHTLGHEIVAEGVETVEQLEALKALGCNTIQGFLFCKPITPSELFDKLKSNFDINENIISPQDTMLANAKSKNHNNDAPPTS